MNQIFNLSRFVKYSANQLSTRKRILLLSVAGAFIALFLFLLVVLSNNGRWNVNDWISVFLGAFVIGAVLFIGNAFPYLRHKEKTISALMIPASVFEKFLYEFLGRVVFYMVFFPVLFYLTAHLVTPLADYLNEKTILVSFDFSAMLQQVHPSREVYIPFLIGIFSLGASLLFAGSIVFKRFPLIKTIVFAGAVVFSVIGYFLFLMEGLDLHRGMKYVIEGLIPSEHEAFRWFFVFFMSSTALAFVYSYFKLKEKEV